MGTVTVFNTTKGKWIDHHAEDDGYDVFVRISAVQKADFNGR